MAGWAGLVVGAVCTVLVVNALPDEHDPDWWKKVVFYQVYPRSFKDTDGDGIGDLKGVKEKLNYVKDLGVGAIWMNPIYESPMFDFGYDVSNFTSVDSDYGNLQDLEDMIKEAHKLGLRVVMDLVPNHSSNKHPWFVASEKNDPKYKNYYVWKESSSKTPPNNWRSIFGGSAWQWSDTRNAFYYHAFLKEQPDLNYREQQVVDEMKNVMTFWMDRGADGFRVDAVPYLVEAASLQDEAQLPDCQPADSVNCLNQSLTMNLDETLDVLVQFKHHLDEYSSKDNKTRMMVLEAVVGPDIIGKYFVYKGNQTSSMAFNFGLDQLNKDSTAEQVKDQVDSWLKALPPGSWSNWQLGNHDQNRITSKTDPGLADGMNMLNLMLPGTAFSYYGEELGMVDGQINCEDIKDPQALRASDDCSVKERLTRDPERTPMPWDTSTYAGFSTGKPWLPVNADSYKVNTDTESKGPSHLTVYKTLVKLREEAASNQCYNITTHTHNKVHDDKSYVFSFSRVSKDGKHKYVVVLNLYNKMQDVKLTDDYGSDFPYLRAASVGTFDSKIGSKVDLESVKLPPFGGVVLSSEIGGAGSLAASLVLTVALLVLHRLH